ncbi:hypothetical protein [Gemmata sp. SH-PL17]|uniref:hypothetical protein n=1 Tax=Gemmata sp. SH-PL17 TaxID=1630693 RepID=UPI0009EE1557|nr:hypothetical protein [Gemmata sp. SH-PL17]
MTKPKPPNAGKGRKKGTPNKFTGTVREAVLAAFGKLGGVRWLVKLGQTNPVEFARLLGRLLPREVSVTSSSATSPPPALSDPKVLAAALALDEICDEVSHALGSGAADAPALQVGEVPPRAPGEPVEAPGEATDASERAAVSPFDDPDPAATR